jgi:hypothetical protein
MRNLIGMSVLAAMMLIPGCASTAQAGASVSVSIGLESGYSTYDDDDMDWDNVLVLDNSRVGVWVTLPSGRWVFRIRNMWWNAEYEEWCFGPWYYDYSIAYNYHSYNHFFGNCGFNPVWFHVYMSSYHRPWHESHFNHEHGRYVRRIDHIRHNPRHGEPARVSEYRREGRSERPAVIVRENNRRARIDGDNRTERIDNRRQDRVDQGNRNERIENNRPNRADNGNHGERIDRSGGSRNGNSEMSRTQTGNRESGNRARSATRTETRRDGRNR